MFLTAAMLLVDDIQTIMGRLERPAAEAAPATATDLPPAAGAAAGVDEPFMTDGVRQALACTYRAYRESHFDACVEDSSVVYERPAEHDEGAGLIDRSRLLMLAALEAPDRYL